MNASATFLPCEKCSYSAGFANLYPASISHIFVDLSHDPYENGMT